MASSVSIGSSSSHTQARRFEIDAVRRPIRFDFDPVHAARVVDIENRTAAMDALVLCKFLRGVFDDFAVEGAELLRLVTGEPIDLEEVGRNVCALRKRFNECAGWTPAMDTLPDRLLGGALSPQKLRAMITTYYRARGWSDEGYVPPPIAERLGLKCHPSR